MGQKQVYQGVMHSRKEIEIVKQEINMYKDDNPDCGDFALEGLIDSLMVPTKEYGSFDILGK